MHLSGLPHPHAADPRNPTTNMAPEDGIRKKMSLHFRWLSKSSQAPSFNPASEELPLSNRGPYKPKHAAADFLRMPMSNRAKAGLGKRNIPVIAHSTGGRRNAIHHPSGRPMSVDAKTTPATTAQYQQAPETRHTIHAPDFARIRETDTDTVITSDSVQALGTRTLNSKPKTLRRVTKTSTLFNVENLSSSDLSPAATLLSPRPPFVRAIDSATTAPTQPSNPSTSTSPGPSSSLPPPLSDYERFIANAEATDRADRERVFETLVRRGRALGLREVCVEDGAYTPGVGLGIQFSEHSNDGGGGGSGSGSGSGSGNLKPHRYRGAGVGGGGTERKVNVDLLAGRTNNTKRMGVLITRDERMEDGMVEGTERKRERDRTPPQERTQQQQQQQQQQQYAGMGITLRRQTSIAQMIAGYIRPTKQLLE